jgi:hypothetical protein
MTSSHGTRPPSRFTEWAYTCHVCLAVIAVPVVYVLAGFEVSDAPGDVIGAALFFLVGWFGLPVLVLASYALYFTVKAPDPALWTLLVTLSGFFVAALVPTPSVVYVAGGALYIALVIGLWLVWLRRRRGAG